MTTRQIHLASVIIAVAAILAACGGGTSKATPTPHPPTPTPKPVATSTAGAVPLPPTNTPEVAASTPSPVVDPCALLTPIGGGPMERGPSFALNVNVKWQLCIGGVSGSEKYLFRTNDAEASWKLISQTTLGNPTPQAGVGQLPSANYVKQILFLDETHGWMGMNSGAVVPNLWRSQDGGVTWASVSAIPPGVPVTSITFTDSQHGTVVTPEGNWTTSDGGVTWTH